MRVVRYRARIAALVMGSMLVLPLVFGSAPTATAAWSTTGSGNAAGAAAVMPTGTAPTGTASSTSVTISWSAAQLSSGTAVAGYTINRYNAATGASATVGAGCSGVVTTTTCTESSVPAGTWVYTDTPVEMSWTGGASPDSATITVP
jgi:hypothetical protein